MQTVLALTDTTQIPSSVVLVFCHTSNLHMRERNRGYRSPSRRVARGLAAPDTIIHGVEIPRRFALGGLEAMVGPILPWDSGAEGYGERAERSALTTKNMGVAFVAAYCIILAGGMYLRSP